MNIKTLAITTEKTNIDLENLETFSGKQAGICYMAGSYSGNITDSEKALSRFFKTVGNNHHSISEHVYITVLLENTSKIMAMLLNSIQAYNTSEKSGRYTVMNGDTPEESTLYEKWMTNCTILLEHKYPDFTAKEINKLAMENARFMLSILSHGTTMSYTASLRMWNYIYVWAKNLKNNIENNPTENDYFNINLTKDLSILCSFIENNISIKELQETKIKDFDSFINFSCNKDVLMNVIKNYKSNYDFVYTSIYQASATGLAQNIRHRTIKYNFYLNLKNSKFFVPEIIKGSSYETEWLEDLNSIKDLVPQATLFDVIERGTIENLFLKAQERACGRAQREVCNIMISQMKECWAQSSSNPLLREIISPYFSSEGKPLMKCEILKGCKEPCKLKNDVKR